MKRIALAFAVLLTISGIVSFNLWKKLQSERQLVTALREESPSSTVVGSTLSANRSTASASGKSESTNEQISACSDSSSKDSLPTEQFVARMEALVARIPTFVSWAPQEVDLMKIPEYRNARLTQMRIAEAQNNPGLAEALGISENEANKLFEVIADVQLKSITELNQNTNGKPKTAAVGDLMRRAGASQTDLLRTHLGSAKYAQLEDYWKNKRPTLVEIARIGGTLSSAGQPLTDSQSQALKSVVLSELSREQMQSASRQLSSNLATPRSTAQVLEESQHIQEESARRIVAAAAPHLSAAQIAILQKQLETQASTNRLSREMVVGTRN